MPICDRHVIVLDGDRATDLHVAKLRRGSAQALGSRRRSSVTVIDEHVRVGILPCPLGPERHVFVVIARVESPALANLVDVLLAEAGNLTHPRAAAGVTRKHQIAECRWRGHLSKWTVRFERREYLIEIPR